MLPEPARVDPAPRSHIVRARLATAAEWLHLAGVGLLLIALGWSHFHIVTMPVPLDYYESMMPLITQLIADGHNPWTLPYTPVHAVVYPPLYNMLVAPFTWLFGNSLQLHRAISALCILGCCALLAHCTRRAGARRVDSVAAAALLYAALLFYSTPVASTNAMGTLLFLLSVLLPWLGGFERRSLALSLLCGVLAFYTKQYFVAGIGIVGAWLLLCDSRRAALVYGAVGAATLLGSLLLVHRASPFFLDMTIFAQANAVSRIHSAGFLLHQLREFATIDVGLLLLAAIALFGAWRTRGIRTRGLPAVRAAALDAPLRGVALPYPWFCFACGTAVIVLVLGHNPGNYLTYLFQFMGPFLLLGTLSLAVLRDRWRALLLPLVWVSGVQAWLLLPRDFTIDMSRWDRVAELVAPHEEILASPIVLDVIRQQGKRVHQGGNTFFFPYAAHKPAWLQPREERLRVPVVWDDYLRRLYDCVGGIL